MKWEFDNKNLFHLYPEEVEKESFLDDDFLAPGDGRSDPYDIVLSSKKGIVILPWKC